MKIPRRSRRETLSLVGTADRLAMVMTDSLAMVEGGEFVPVVAVLIANESINDVQASLSALHGQSYGALRVLIAADRHMIGEIEALVAQGEHHPDVITEVRSATFTDVANQAVGIVGGDNGLFWMIESGTIPEPRALHHLVTELLETNAAVVGPKIVDADDVNRLQSVGITVDRFGERVEPFNLDEADQEQHDRVRDVLAVDASGMLVRADLFRELGGFASPMSSGTADVELCWRAHCAGARVMVVPDAVIARPKERVTAAIASRSVSRLQVARDEVDMVLVTASAQYLVVRVVQIFGVSLLQVILGIFLGAIGPPARRLAAVLSAPFRIRSIRERRKHLRQLRLVSEAEISSLLYPITSRLTAIVRIRDDDDAVVAGTPMVRQRERTYGPTLAWFLIILGLLIGSREFIRSGVPGVGGWLSNTETSGELFRLWWDPWDSRGVGLMMATAGGVVVLGILSAVPLVGSLLTGWGLGVGAVLLGLLGLQRLAGVYPTARPRVVALVIYAAGPIVPSMLGAGDIAAFAVYAVLPWVVHLTRQLAGIVVADVSTVDGDLVDGVLSVSAAKRRRMLFAIILVTAAGGSFAPVVVPLVVMVLVLLALSSWLMRSPTLVVARFFLAAVAASTSWLLLLPSSLGWRWSTLTGGELTGVSVADARHAMSFGGDGGFGLLGVALIVPVISALLITRAWRLTWAVRGASLVAMSLLLILLAGRGVATAYLPPASVLSVVMLFGATLPAAGIASGFGSDVLDRAFGWRQPLALCANLAIAVSVVPGILSVGAGDWDASPYPMSSVVETQFPSDSSIGAYRVLWVGDPRVLPVHGHEFAPGISFVITDAGGLTLSDAFVRPEGDDARIVRDALTLLSTGSTSRVGRLLAPLGVRFVAIPLADGIASTFDDPINPPDGLSPALAAQLDIGVIQSPPTIEAFVNRSWIPPAAFLTGGAANASRNAGAGSLLLADLDGIAAVELAGDGGEEFVDAVMAQGPQVLSVPSEGVLHLGVPFDERWRVTLDGAGLLPRAGFGQTVAFDIPSGGEITVSYDALTVSYAFKGFIALAWFGAFLAATRPQRRMSKRHLAIETSTMTFTSSSGEPSEHEAAES